MTRLQAEIQAEQIIGTLDGWMLYTSQGRLTKQRRHHITNGKKGKHRWHVEGSNWPAALLALRKLALDRILVGW